MSTNALTLESLARLVERMRTAQRYYFRVRTPEALEGSKALERQVDSAVRAALEQPGLPFGE